MKRFLLLTSALFLSACAPNEPTVTLHGPDGEDVEVIVEIADSPEELSLGLMGRESIEENHGMLFVFPDSFQRTFWMKNTLLPLDIMFFDEAGAFVSKTSMEPCNADPCPLYPSEGPAMYALETQVGFADANSVGDGWTIDLRALDR